LSGVGTATNGPAVSGGSFQKNAGTAAKRFRDVWPVYIDIKSPEPPFQCLLTWNRGSDHISIPNSPIRVEQRKVSEIKD